MRVLEQTVLKKILEKSADSSLMLTSGGEKWVSARREEEEEEQVDRVELNSHHNPEESCAQCPDGIFSQSIFDISSLSLSDPIFPNTLARASCSHFP